MLGEGGRTIKTIEQLASREIGEIAEAEVHLFLFVKVRENWGDDPERYREMGLRLRGGGTYGRNRSDPCDGLVEAYYRRWRRRLDRPFRRRFDDAQPVGVEANRA